MGVKYYNPGASASVHNENNANKYHTDYSNVSIPQYPDIDERDGDYKKYNNGKVNKSDIEMESIAIIKEYKKPCEANVVLSLYSSPDLYNDCNLDENSFTYNGWRVYFVIFRDLYMQNKTLTEDNIDFYLQQHLKLKEQYKKYGGYETIEKGVMVAPTDDFNSYLNDLIKWNCVYTLATNGFPIKDKIKDFVDKTTQDIYDSYTDVLNNAFLHIEEKIKSYNACEGLDELNKELDKGMEKGIPFGINVGTPECNFKLMNRITDGFHINGNIYGLGALSGVGKSTQAIQMMLPLAFREKLTSVDGTFNGMGALPGHRVVFMVNEEDEKKFKREMEVWIINNILLKNKPETPKFNKSILSRGGFTSEQWALLDEASRWLKEYESNHRITVIPLETYSASTAIKIIKKYAKLFGVKIFVLDTLKESRDKYGVDTWKSMERDLVDLYNAVKPANLNVGLFVTYQLAKQAKKVRYLTETEIGQAKNIIDVMSVNIMMRKAYSDEYEGCKNAIKLRTRDEHGQLIDLPGLTPDKKYMIIFINKNRFGETDPYQIVVEIDQGFNIYKEIGITYMTPDF